MVASKHNTHSPKVLCIDDDKDIHTLIRLFLSEESCEFIFAKDGLSGIRLAKSETPDLVVLDLGLPNGSGRTVLNILKSTDQFTGKIMVLTGDDSPAVKDDVIAIGVDAFILKPMVKQTMVGAFKKLIGSHPQR